MVNCQIVNQNETPAVKNRLCVLGLAVIAPKRGSEKVGVMTISFDACKLTFVTAKPEA